MVLGNFLYLYAQILLYPQSLVSSNNSYLQLAGSDYSIFEHFRKAKTATKSFIIHKVNSKFDIIVIYIVVIFKWNPSSHSRSSLCSLILQCLHYLKIVRYIDTYLTTLLIDWQIIMVVLVIGLKICPLGWTMFKTCLKTFFCIFFITL